jgi:hypothetical protein
MTYCPPARERGVPGRAIQSRRVRVKEGWNICAFVKRKRGSNIRNERKSVFASSCLPAFV